MVKTSGGTWHSRFDLRYHLVLVTKYRRPTIDDAVLDTIQECFTRVFEQYGCAMLALNHDRNHLHLLFSAPPQVKLSSLVCALKTVSSREVRKRHAAWLRQFYWKPVFWSRSYYIGSVGDTTAEIVEIYIHNQGKAPANK